MTYSDEDRAVYHRERFYTIVPVVVWRMFAVEQVTATSKSSLAVLCRNVLEHVQSQFSRDMSSTRTYVSLVDVLERQLALNDDLDYDDCDSRIRDNDSLIFMFSHE
jgi:competence CoiA-like predicted nuclease